jgi:uncharacterized metal-binding protein
MCTSSGVMRAPMLMSSSATATRLLLLADCPAIHCAATTTAASARNSATPIIVSARVFLMLAFLD